MAGPASLPPDHAAPGPAAPDDDASVPAPAPDESVAAQPASPLAARPDRRVFWCSLAVYPLAAALWLVWTTLTYSAPDAGAFDYLHTLLVSLMIAAILPLPVLAWAAWRRKPLQALAGLGLGVLAAIVAVPLSLQLIGARRVGQFEGDQARFAAFAQTVRGGDRARIRAELRRLPGDFSAPRALCALGGGATYTHQRWLWFNDHAYGEPLPSAQLHTAATAVVEGDWPRAEKQAALLVLLRYLIERDEPDRFAPWTGLWRATLEPPAPSPLPPSQARASEAAAPPPARLPLLAPDYAGDYGGCDLGDPADPVFRHWHDQGLRSWLLAGFGFAGDQHRAALRAVRSKEILDALFAADLEFARLLGSEHALGQQALWAQADSLSERMDAMADPTALADLVQTLAQASVDPTRSESGVAPCQRFKQTEAERAGREDTPQRRAAATRIFALLCKRADRPAGTPATAAIATPAPAPHAQRPGSP